MPAHGFDFQPKEARDLTAGEDHVELDGGTKLAELQTLAAIAARAEADSRAEQIKPEPTMA